LYNTQPGTLMGKSWENFRLAVQYASVLHNPVKSCLLMQTALLGDNAGVTWQWPQGSSSSSDGAWNERPGMFRQMSETLALVQAACHVR